jgi:hypothetical protein
VTAAEGWCLAAVIAAVLAVLADLARLRDPAPVGSLVAARALGHVAVGCLAAALLIAL